METEGSPASILAIRDWLDPISRAASSWVRRRRFLCSFTNWLRAILISMYSSSSSVSSRNSRAPATFQPCASSNLRFALSILPPSDSPIILSKTLPAHLESSLRRLPRALGKHLSYHNRVWINPVDDAPCASLIENPKLVNTPADGWQGPRMRQRQWFTPLQQPKQVSRFDPRLR